MKKVLSLMLVLGVIFSIIGTGPFSVFADEAEDQRVYIHGVNFVQLGGQDVLVFSSDQYPPSEPADTNGEWVHDVYYSVVDPGTAPGVLDAGSVHTLVSKQYAQEPASAAVNSAGSLVVTTEDAEFHLDSLDQTYGMWSNDLIPLVPYGVQLMKGGGSDPTDPDQGGHSGHVAASGDKFLVSFCDGWTDETEEDDNGNIIQGGGVDGLGEGEDIFARIVNADGSMGPLLQTSVGPDYNEWWPLVAGSDTNWLQIYQRYEGQPGVPTTEGGTLWGAITTADNGGTVGTPFKIADGIKYYYYDVTYVPSIQEYLVTGTNADGGFMTLVDKNGNIKATKTGLPDTVREAKTVIHETADGITAVYPTFPSGAAVVNISGNSINLAGAIEGSHEWDYMGTAGIFASDSEVLFATGTTSGIQFVRFDILKMEEEGSDETGDDYSFLENVALGKSATATSEYTDEENSVGTFSADKAFDGDYDTRWDSLEGSDILKPQELTVDLGDIYAVKKVVLHWDSSAIDYKIQFSDDGTTWTDAYATTSGGTGDADVIDAAGYTRYVKFVGNTRQEEDWGFSISEFEVYGYKPFETYVPTWKDDKDAAVTYGFAGAFKESLGLVEPLMEQYGIKGTGYIYPGDVGSWNALPTWDEYKAIADKGHISFGYFGPSWRGHFVNKDGTWADGVTSGSALELITDGKNAIESNIGQPAEVMMGNDYYTGGNDELAKIMSDNFLATMRGDFENYINQPNITDYYNLGGAVIYPNAGWGTPAEDAAGLRNCVDEAIKQKGFVAIEGRGVYDDATTKPEDSPDWWSPTPLSFYANSFAYVDEHRDSIWNDTLGNIVKYMSERDALTVDVKSYDDNGVTIGLTSPQAITEKLDSFGNPVYNQPVTIKTSVPNAWLSAAVKQGDGAETTVVPVIEDGKKWIMYDVVPGAGDVSVTAGETGDYISTGKIKASVVDGTVAVTDTMDKIAEGDKFVVRLTNSTFRAGITKDNILLTGLPEGLTYDAAVVPGTNDTLEITLGGSSAKPMTRSYNLELVIKGNSVNELEATNSNSIILQIAGNAGNAGDTVITPWKDNKAAAYTATYDDGIIDSLKRFLTLHEKYGFKATIALVPGFIDKGKHPDDGLYEGNGGHVSMGTWDDFRELVASGYFEVASHMMDHAMKGDEGRGVPDFLDQEGAAALEQDFRDSKARLEQELGVPVNTLIYPHYDTNDDINAIAEKVYESARGGGDEFDGNSPDGTNYYNLYSKTFLDYINAGPSDTTVDEARGWLDKAIEKGYWLITVGHGNNYEGWGAPPLSVYDGFYAYVAEKMNDNTVWVDTMGTISEYMKERNSSTVALESSTATSYDVSLTDTLDNSVYDQALTVRTNVPADWTNVVVTQGNKVLPSRIENGDALKYVYYDVLPDSGDVTVAEAASGSHEAGGIVAAPVTTTVNGNVITVQPIVDSASGTSTSTVDKDAIDSALKSSDTAVVKVPAAEGVNKYAVNLPASALSSSGSQKRIEIETDIGKISAPGNMFGADEIGGAGSVNLSIARADTAGLDPDVLEQIGSKPVVELSAALDGKPVSWNNPGAPVNVSIPYTPTEEEKANPEHITVWYIDGSGNIVSVPSGRYDTETGMVTFTTTHFSKYAVAYVEKTFTDLNGYGWARNAIEVMASKGVISGTSSTNYSPSSNITRGDFVLLLTKALNLSAKVDGNFSDVSPSAGYYEAVGVAKKLGITAGAGNNKFNPDANITRQEMMALTDRALTAAKEELAAGADADLSKFADKDKIAAYAVQSVAKLIKNGIVSGSGSNINPLGNTTRAEAAVIIYKIYNAGLGQK